MTKERDTSIDLLKGIGMIFVVIGHASATMNVSSYIYTFHMPLFAFIGGIFLRTNQPFTIYAKHKADKLLTPFFLWSLFFWVIYGIVIFFAKEDMINSHLKQLMYIAAGSGQNSTQNVANVTLWFLPFLFSSAIIHYVVSFSRTLWLELVLVFIISLLAVGFSKLGKPLPYSTDTAFALYPFMYAGSKYLKIIKQWVNKLTILQSVVIVALLILLHFSTYLREYRVNDFVVDTASNNIGNYFLFYIGGFAAIGYWTIICSKIRQVKILNYIGRNTIIILLLHYPIIQLIQLTFMPSLSCFEKYGLYGLIQTILCLLLCVPCIYIINKYMQWSIGGKKFLSK